MDHEQGPGYGLMKKKALGQFRPGKSLYGKGGGFVPLLKSFLDAALEAGLEGHLDEAGRSSGNRKNGKTSNEVRTSDGTTSINTPPGTVTPASSRNWPASGKRPLPRAWNQRSSACMG